MTPTERKAAIRRELVKRELQRREALSAEGPGAPTAATTGMPSVSRETMRPTAYEPPIPPPVNPGLAPVSLPRRAAQAGLALGEGATLNWLPEIGAGLETILGQAGVPRYSPSYDVNYARAQRTFEDIPPGLRLAGNLGGGFLTGAGTGAALAPRGAAALMGAGALEGAIAGAGAGETPAERLVGAGAGAAGGALFGYLAPKTVAGVTNLYNRVRSGMTRAENKAARKIIQNLERDLISPDDAVRQLQAVEGATLADLPFARNTLGLARAVESSPGPGAAAITRTLAERQIGRPERIREAVRSMISDRNFGQTRQQLIANRRETANRLYGIARQRGVISSERLNEILSRPAVSKAIGRLQKNLVTEDGTPLSRLPRNNIEVIDALYKDLVQKSFTPAGDAASGLSGRSINRIRLDLRDELSELAPEYALALEKYSGDKALEEALEAGADAFRGRDRDLITPNFVKSLGESEREQFLVGLARAAQEGIDSGASPVAAMKRLKAPKNRAVIQAAVGDKRSADAFMDAMERELQFAATERAVIGGSPTARIQAERADAAANALDLSLEAARGDVGQATKSGIDMLLAGMRRGRPAGQLDPGVSEALSQMLTQPVRTAGPGQGMLQQALNRQLASQQLSGLLGLGATTGTTTAGAQMLPLSQGLVDPAYQQPSMLRR